MGKQYLGRFRYLVGVFRNKGYTVLVEENEVYNFAIVTGKNIYGGFATGHDKEHYKATVDTINGKIAVSNHATFTEWDKVEKEIDLPRTDEDLSNLLKEIELVGNSL